MDERVFRGNIWRMAIASRAIALPPCSDWAMAQGLEPEDHGL
ncbi:hypothetical protein [Leptolyngbya sp. FACHB-8]|nr:hypothetical protein [Leptolyngbya sp. FACHB-8]